MIKWEGLSEPWSAVSTKCFDRSKVFAGELSYRQMNLCTKFCCWRSVSSEDLMVLWLALQPVEALVFGSSSQLIPDKGSAS